MASIILDNLAAVMTLDEIVADYLPLTLPGIRTAITCGYFN